MNPFLSQLSPTEQRAALTLFQQGIAALHAADWDTAICALRGCLRLASPLTFPQLWVEATVALGDALTSRGGGQDIREANGWYQAALHGYRRPQDHGRE